MTKPQITLEQFIDQILNHFVVGQFDVASALCRELLSRRGSAGQEANWLGLIAELCDVRLQNSYQGALDELAQRWHRLQLHSLLCASLSQRQKKLEMALQSHFGRIEGTPSVAAPLHIMNVGLIRFGKNVQFGYPFSAHFLSSYIYLNARHTNGGIEIGDNTTINNGSVLISEWHSGTGISIGSGNLIGVNLKVYDTDFHGISRNNRSQVACAPVKIGNECFFGDNVTVMKGVTIGSGVTVASNSVVTGDIPDDVLAGGTPAKVIRKLL